MLCKPIEKVQAKRKASKILELIGRKVQETEVKRLSKLKSVEKELNKLMKAQKEYDEASKIKSNKYEYKENVAKEVSKKLKDFELEAYTYNPKSLKQLRETLQYTGCTVSKEDHDQLQLAQDMVELGKKKEAHEIFESLIKKYKLLS